jgi:GT2 family glycosyltransferase
MTISIIIVHFKTFELTDRCIRNIINSNSQIEYEIIVIDNDSNDGAAKKIINNFPLVKWVLNSENEGFGRANNLGVKYAKGEYILLLNSDMIVNPETLDKTIEILINNSKIGALGCKLTNEDGSDQKSVYFHVGDFEGVLKDNLFYNYLFYKQPTKIKGIMGAFMLIPKKVFEEVGGFDPDFFMYAEELELCNRIGKAGYKIEFTEETTAIHKHGGSSSNKQWAYRQNLLSNALHYLKIKGLGGYLIYHFLCHVNTVTNFILMWKLDKNYRKGYWQGQKDYYSNYLYYLQIPFLYSKKTGNGKRFLKRG